MGWLCILELDRMALTRVKSTTDDGVLAGADVFAAEEFYKAAFPRASFTSKDEGYDGARGGDL